MHSAHSLSFRFPFDLQINSISLLVLRLRNKKLLLLTQQRRLEGSNALKKELRWFWDTDLALIYSSRIYTRDVDM